MLNCPDFLPRLFELTSDPKKTISKTAYWTISNIGAGSQEQIDLLIENPGYMKRILDGFSSKNSVKIPFFIQNKVFKDH